MSQVLSPRPSEATSWHTSGDERAEFARAIGSRLRGSVHAEAGASDLPPGWELIHDVHGGAYYYHAASGLSQWETPTEDTTRELTSLSIAEVGRLLESLGMGGLRSNFGDNFVDGRSLSQVDGHDLEKLGVAVGAVRRGLLMRVDKLKTFGVPTVVVQEGGADRPPSAAEVAILPLEPLLAALRRWGVEPAVAGACCEALAALCAAADEQREEACEAGAPEAIVATLTAHAADLGVQRAACLALGGVCQGADAETGARGATGETAALARRQRCADCGGLERAVCALQAAPRDAGVQEAALKALGLLCFGSDASSAARKHRAGELGGLIAAISAMRSHPACRELQLQGCRALATIAVGSDALEERAKAEGALQAAVASLQGAQPTDDELRQIAGRLSSLLGEL